MPVRVRPPRPIYNGDINMKLEINLDDIECYEWNQSVAEIIKEEIQNEVRLAVKRELKNKNAELAKAVQAFANAQAEQIKKDMEKKMLGI